MLKSILLPTNTWPNTKNAQEVLFFALLLREALYNKSWQSYKIYTLSSLQRLVEIQIIGNKVSKRLVPKDILKPCLAEARKLIVSDPIISEIVKLDIAGFCKAEFKIERSVQDIISSARYLETLIEKSYDRQCRAMIIDCCFHNHNRVKLRNIAKLYVTFLIGKGYSEDFISNVLISLFFSSNIKRVDKNKLNNFFNRFDFKTQHYKIFIGVSQHFARILKTTIHINTYNDSSEVPKNLAKNFPQQIGSGKKSSIIEFEINAKDDYSAFYNSQESLDMLKSLLFLHPHNVATKSEKCAYVIPIKKKAGEIHHTKDSALRNMSAKSTKLTEGAFKRLTHLLFGNETIDDQSRARFLRAANSALLAEKSSSQENQLVSIWAAFETLLPEVFKDDGVRINRFCEMVVPCIVKSYMFQTMSNFDKLLKYNFEDEYRNIIRNGNNKGSDVRNLTQLILTGSKNEKEAICKVLSNSPLALNRISYLENLLKSPQSFHRYINGHQERVHWQLHRIYRERNFIVHSSMPSPFLSGLVTNAVNYFREACEAIIISMKRQNLHNIDECIIGLRFQHTQNMEELKKLQRPKTTDPEAYNKMVMRFIH